MNCKQCGQEINEKAVVCTNCGCKIKKPFYKKWWVWVIVGIVVIAIASSGENNTTTSTGNDTTSPVTNTETTQNAPEEIVYEAVDLQTMFDELDSNAMKAENTYKKKNIEFKCKIKSFDSSGSYICVEPKDADEWNFSSAMCYIKNDDQKEFLINKNVGDIINIKGKVKSVGEIMGYSIDINEVQ